jgi:hypothetical protein
MRSTIRTSAALILVAAFAACSDSNDPDNGLPQDFSGNYTLVSFAIGGIEIPGTTGTFTMTATTYEASVSVPGQGDANLQYQGEYTWNASTSELTLDTSVQGVRNVLVLERQ